MRVTEQLRENNGTGQPVVITKTETGDFGLQADFIEGGGAAASRVPGILFANLLPVVDLAIPVAESEPIIIPSDPTTTFAPTETWLSGARARFSLIGQAAKQDFALHLRGAREEDIDQLVTVDLKTFDSVYADWKIENGGKMTEEELKSYLTGMFTERVEMLGGQWIRVLEKGGKIVGCIVACPTSKPPEGFKSWEDTTDNGSLATTYDPDGKFLYVVSLSAMPEVSAQNGKDMLMANMIGRIIGGNYHAYFESRLPGLKRWILTQCRQTKTRFGNLSQEEMDGYASLYLRATTEIDGKKVPIDPLLRDYASVGCSFLKVVPDAYKDKRSLSYGAVCEFDHRLANIVRRIPVVRKAAGGAIGLASHSSFITQIVL
jgi:hypothetical protein